MTRTNSEHRPAVRRQGKRLVGWVVFVLSVLAALGAAGVSVGPLPAL